jgi:HAD superfamily hydrolase (TIGR01549 family)
MSELAIDVLCLDAGGVLVHPNWERVSAALKHHGVSLLPAELARAEPLAKLAIDRGEVIGATNDAGRGWLYFNNVLEAAGVTLSEATDAALEELRGYHAEQNLWEETPADLTSGLDRLRALGLTLIVVSNANGRLRHLLDRIGLSRWFDVILDSHEIGVEKPDPRLFHIALERAGGSPERAMHVGDLYHVDVVGARAAGLRAVLLDEAGLYTDADCPRVRSVSELADKLAAGAL